MKQLSKKQKTILIVGIGAFILATFIITTLVIYSRSEKPVSVPSKDSPFPNNSSLIEAKNEAISLIEQNLASDVIKEKNFLKKLKDKNYLEANSNAMKIIEKEYGLKSIKPNKLEIISDDQSELIKFGVDNFGEVIDEWKTKEIFFIPVNNSSNPNSPGSGGHWSLLVCDAQNKTFHYYDSLGSANLGSAQKIAKKFAKILWEKEGELPLEIEEAAQQSDGSSCGAFTMAHIKFLAERYRDKGDSEPMN
nr:9076_t:CDS:2 [Entrophospora candida]